MSVDYLNTLANEDIAQQRERGEDGGQGGFLVYVLRLCVCDDNNRGSDV